jgi:hypothetical protein
MHAVVKCGRALQHSAVGWQRCSGAVLLLLAVVQCCSGAVLLLLAVVQCCSGAVLLLLAVAAASRGQPDKQTLLQV